MWYDADQSYRATLERIFSAPGAPGVAVYNAALPDPGEILDATVERLRTAYDVDVLGAVVAAQVAAPVLRAAGGGTLLFTSGGFADNPVPALASLSMGKAALRSAQTLIAAGVQEDGIHAATVTIAGAVKPGTDFDPDNIAELFWTAHTDPKDAWQTEYRFTGRIAGRQRRDACRWPTSSSASPPGLQLPGADDGVLNGISIPVLDVGDDHHVPGEALRH